MHVSNEKVVQSDESNKIIIIISKPMMITREHKRVESTSVYNTELKRIAII